jgi:cytoskeletal protein CcmA (bactofilin family)
MFLRNKPASSQKIAISTKKEMVPTCIARGTHIIGNIVHEGVLDFDGTLDGNIRCDTLTVRANGRIKGDITAENLFVYGKVIGVLRAKNVVLHATCHIEGVVMHESLSMEDGAFLDGKCKRTNKPANEDSNQSENEDESDEPKAKVLENIRLIR